jgi:hypothetical protein
VEELAYEIDSSDMLWMGYFADQCSDSSICDTAATTIVNKDKTKMPCSKGL